MKFTNNLYTDPTAFEIVALTVPVSTSNNEFLYLATYDLTGSPILDTNPDGKVFTQGFLTHMGTHTDPHSDVLVQTNMVITGSFNVGLRVDESITVTQENIGSIAPLITLQHVNNTVPLLKSIDEFIIQDVRMTTRLSEVGETSFDNGKISIVGAINENTSLISVNAGDISTNTTNISNNASDIVTNETNIGTNATNIGTNTTNIGTNTTDISTNAVDIATNTANIATNVGDIAQNANDILANSNNIAVNIVDIAQNASDIVILDGQVSINTPNIAINAADILDLQIRVAALECEVFGLCSSSSSSSSI